MKLVAASSSVSKTFMCLDSTPLSVGSGKTGSASGEEGSPSHCSDDPALLESSVSPPQSNMVLRKRIRKIKQGMRRYNSQLTLMRRDLRSCKAKIAEQQKQIVEYANRMDDTDKKNDEMSRKFSTLLQVCICNRERKADFARGRYARELDSPSIDASYGGKSFFVGIEQV